MLGRPPKTTLLNRPRQSLPPFICRSQPSLEKLRILLAEDNRINRKVALAQLGKLGYQAQAVANGLEVVEALKQVPYDVMLMDCQMPEMDGYEATQAIRKMEQELRWTLSLEGAGLHHRDDCPRHAGRAGKVPCCGMDDYLSKPIRIPLLKAALDRRKEKSEPLPETNK